MYDVSNVNKDVLHDFVVNRLCGELSAFRWDSCETSKTHALELLGVAWGMYSNQKDLSCDWPMCVYRSLHVCDVTLSCPYGELKISLNYEPFWSGPYKSKAFVVTVFCAAQQSQFYSHYCSFFNTLHELLEKVASDEYYHLALNEEASVQFASEMLRLLNIFEPTLNALKVFENTHSKIAGQDLLYGSDTAVLVFNPEEDWDEHLEHELLAQLRQNEDCYKPLNVCYRTNQSGGAGPWAEFGVKVFTLNCTEAFGTTPCANKTRIYKLEATRGSAKISQSSSDFFLAKDFLLCSAKAVEAFTQFIAEHKTPNIWQKTLNLGLKIKATLREMGAKIYSTWYN